MNREKVIGAIRQTKEELGHVPTIQELKLRTGVGEYDIRRNFGVYTEALLACGLERRGSGYELSQGQIFADWSQVTRLLGKVPTLAEYTLHGRYSVKPLTRHFGGGWMRLPAGMAKFARENGLEDSAKDVLEVVERHLEGQAGGAGPLIRPSRPLLLPGLMKGEPVYGPPTVNAHLMLRRPMSKACCFCLARWRGSWALWCCGYRRSIRIARRYGRWSRGCGSGYGLSLSTKAGIF